MEGKERRKRRWDLDDQGKEAKSPVEETAVSKAAQAAAAIAAKLTSTTESDHQPAAIAVAVEKKVDEPSLYETLGIKPDEKPKKPKIDESLKDTITKRLDINDTRHRYYLTKDTTQEMVQRPSTSHLIKVRSRRNLVLRLCHWESIILIEDWLATGNHHFVSKCLAQMLMILMHLLPG